MQGFYKNDFGVVLHGPHFVLNKDYELKAEQHETYEYPVDGWYWFETEKEAYAFFEIEMQAQV
jgi:hypothetical protein